ncbi:hypothetical protein GC173_01420 [bacterium]|nr:hypothetical protein [bacterium]
MSLNRDNLPISRWRSLLVVAAVAWLAMLCWWHRRVVIDDPWITFRYAQNLLGGDGLCFNPGERLEGYSNLTWVLLTVPALMAQIEPLGWARLMAFACSAAMIALLVIGWRRSNDDSMSRSAVAGFALASTVPLAVWTMGGLETALQSFLLLVYTLSLAAFLERGSTLPGTIATAAAALLAMTRPEGFAFGVLLGLGLLKRETRFAAFNAISALFVCLAFYTTWRYMYFGTIVANTVTAKVGGSLWQRVWTGLVYTGNFFEGPLLVVLVLAGFAVVRRMRALRSPSQWTGDVALVRVAHLVVLMQVAFCIAVGGDWMPGGRFLVPALAPLCLLMAVAVRRWPLFVRGVLVCFLLLGGLIDGRADRELRWYRWAGRESGGLVTAPLDDVGRWLAAHGNRDDLVAGPEAGVIPYVSGMRFLDMVGLVDAHVAQVEGTMHHKTDADYILSRKPDWIVLTFFEQDGKLVPPWPSDAAVFAHPEFSRVYTEAYRRPRFLADGAWNLRPGLIVVYTRSQAR